MQSIFKCIPLACTTGTEKHDSINRSSCQLTNLSSNYEIFASKKTLIKLELQRNQLTSSTFNKFFQTSFPKLEYLDISDNELCDRFFSTIANFQQIKNLKSLFLNRNPILIFHLLDRCSKWALKVSLVSSQSCKSVTVSISEPWRVLIRALDWLLLDC